MGNGAAEEDWRWDLNPGTAAMLGEDHRALVESGPRGFGVLLLPCDLGSRRDLAGKKRCERTLAGGP